MLDWFAEAPDPDAGLFGFRRISESLGRTPWYLKTLRDEGEVAQRLARLLATSRYAIRPARERAGRASGCWGRTSTPLAAEPLTEEMLAAGGRRDDPRGGGAGDPRRTPSRAVPDRRRRPARPHRRRRRRRWAVPAHRRDARGDPRGGARVGAGGQATSTRPPTRMAIVAMGRYGGFELSYGSDADVLFVHDPRGRASTSTRRRRTPRPSPTSCAGCSRCPAATRPLEVDADLRPEGKQGPLVRSPGLVRRLLRQVVEGLGGPGAAARRRGGRRPRPAAAVRGADRPAALPRGRALRGRRGRGTPDQGARRQGAAAARRRPQEPPQARPRRPRRHRVDRAAAADAALRARSPGLRTPRTLEALDAAREAGLLDADGRRRARSTAGGRSAGSATRSRWSRARAATSCPHDIRDRAAVASILGYPAGATDAMVNDLLRTMRISRAVVDRVFWE